MGGSGSAASGSPCSASASCRHRHSQPTSQGCAREQDLEELDDSLVQALVDNQLQGAPDELPVLEPNLLLLAALANA